MHHDLMIQSILYFYLISVGEQINLVFVVAGGCIVWFSMHIAHFTRTHTRRIHTCNIENHDIKMIIQMNS